MQRLALAPLGPAGRIIGGELPNSEHVFDVSLGQAYALRRLGPASVRLAASRAFDRLSRRFGPTNPPKWRGPGGGGGPCVPSAQGPPPPPPFSPPAVSACRAWSAA